MKKVIIFIISLITVLNFNLNVFAAAPPTKAISTSTVLFEDGSYIEKEIFEQTNDISTFSSTKSGSARITYKNSDDEIMWTATLTATFKYTGSSATCTSSNITYNVNDSSWQIVSATTSKSGNTAIGYVTAKHYFVGVPIKTVEESITLTCSANGTLS